MFVLDNEYEEARKPNFSNPTSFDEVVELINLALGRCYQFGVSNGERTVYEGQADFESYKEKWVEKLSAKIDQFFLDNR